MKPINTYIDMLGLIGFIVLLFWVFDRGAALVATFMILFAYFMGVSAGRSR